MTEKLTTADLFRARFGASDSDFFLEVTARFGHCCFSEGIGVPSAVLYLAYVVDNYSEPTGLLWWCLSSNRVFLAMAL